MGRAERNPSKVLRFEGSRGQGEKEQNPGARIRAKGKRGKGSSGRMGRAERNPSKGSRIRHWNFEDSRDRRIED